LDGEMRRWRSDRNGVAGSLPPATSSPLNDGVP